MSDPCVPYFVEEFDAMEIIIALVPDSIGDPSP
jgi:hypothetical protein